MANGALLTDASSLLRCVRRGKTRMLERLWSHGS